jgi:prolipoprotein diacylglyceryltransferase
LLAAWWVCRRRHEPLAAVLDAAALPIAVLGLLGWGGCLAAGCAYGFEVTPGAWPAWLTTHAPDLYGLTLPRFSTQLLGVAWSALALLALWLLQARAMHWPAGTFGALALVLVAFGLFALSLTRGDPSPRLGTLRADTAGGGLVFILTALAWTLRRYRRSATATPAPMPTR